MKPTTYFRFPGISADLGECLEAILNLALFAQEQSGIIDERNPSDRNDTDLNSD
jgi:hypothetical protein